MPFTFRPPTLDDAAITVAWRTDPAITRFMFTDLEKPSVEGQRAWLAAMAERADFRHFIIEHQGEPVGYLCYTDIDPIHRRCMTGSYMATDAARRLLSAHLYAFIMDYAFHGLGVRKIVNHFMAGNDNVIKIQRVLRHREVGVLRDHIRKYDRWHDVHVFEFLASDWAAQKRTFTTDQTRAAFGAYWPAAPKEP